MKIAFDGTIFASPSKNRGLGRHARFLVTYLLECLSDEDSLYLVNYNGLDFAHEYNDVRIKRLNIYLGPFKGFEYDKPSWLFTCKELEVIGSSIIERELIAVGIDVFFIFNHDCNPFNFIKHIKSHGKCKVKFVVGLQDLIPLVMPYHYFKDPKRKRLYMDSIDVLKYADHITANSLSAKEDSIKYLDISTDKISVTYLGTTLNIGGQTINSLFLELQQKLNISKPYILYTGGDEFRKNIDGLIKAFAHTEKNILLNFQLVIVCSLGNRDFYEALITEYGLNGKVILTGYVSDEELGIIYQNAKAAIFPSLYEGFGLPVLEAMYFGLPVAVSKTSSMPEITGLDGIFFDPTDLKDMACAISKILLNDKIIQEQRELSLMRKELFSWEKCATQTMGVFRGLFSNVKQKIADKKFKVAMFSPMPPEKTGIADYSLERIPFWSKYFDVDIFTKYSEQKLDILGADVNIYTYGDFDKMASKYDNIIYQMGNSEYHTEIMHYLQKYPGIVVMHDYNLKGLTQHLYHTSQISAEQLDDICFIQYEHDSKIKKEFALCDNSENLEINRFVTANALGVIVHSQFAKDNLQKFNVGLPIKIAPLGSVFYDTIISEDAINSLMKKYRIRSGDIVLGSFGYISENKRVFQIMEAFAEYICSIHDKKHYKLLLVGEVFDKAKFTDFFNILDSRYNIKDNITVTGWTTIDEFEELMHIVDFAFNLRYPSQGETSAALARLMMMGKPVVVTDIATFSEIPDACCIKIRYDHNEKGDIKRALKTLIENEEVKSKISDNAKQFMNEKCNLNLNAKAYLEMINIVEGLYSDSLGCIVNELLFARIYDCYKRYFPNDTEFGLNRELPSIAETLFRLQTFERGVSNTSDKKLHIIFDGTIFVEVFNQQSHRSGIFLVAYNLLVGLLKHSDIHVVLYSSDESRDKIIKAIADIPVELSSKLVFFNNGKKEFEKQVAAADIFFSPVFAVPDIFRKLKKIKLFIILYDALPLIRSEFFCHVKKEDTWNNTIIKKFNDDFYGYVSECTKNDYIKCGLPLDTNNSFMLPLAASELFYHCTDLEQIVHVRQKYGIPSGKKYVFSLCSIEPRKNLIFACECFLLFIKKHNIEDLIFVLGGAHWDSFIDKFNAQLVGFDDYKKYIFRAGYIADEDLAPLYSDALFFIYPSLYEGFGLPPLEAMQCGAPVITSSISSIPEVMGDVGILVDPESRDAIVAAMEQMYFNEDLRVEQSKKGIKRASQFSWESTVEILVRKFRSSARG